MAIGQKNSSAYGGVVFLICQHLLANQKNYSQCPLRLCGEQNPEYFQMKHEFHR